MHNHSFVDKVYSGMLPAHRKMSEYDKYQMSIMRNVGGGGKTRHIFGMFAHQAGGYDKVGYHRQDMYNEQQRQRKSDVCDAKKTLDFLKECSSKDDSFYWRHTVNKDGGLEHLFWCDGTARKDLSVFGDVLAFDATYKKNKYLCPVVVFSGVNHHNQSIVFPAAIVIKETNETYAWLLERFLEAMGGKSPISVITDGDNVMRNAIKKVFPKARYCLCAWHLIRNATANVKNLQFVTKFKQCMLGDFDVSEFERRWVKMVAEFGLENNNWVSELYSKRDMWATAHIRGNFFAGFRTTSRCEGLHSKFGKYVNLKDNLLDFMKQFMRWINYMRFREVEADFTSSFGDHMLQSPLHKLEESAAKVYTREVLSMLVPIFNRSCTCRVKAKKQSGSLFNFCVVRYGKKGVKWNVTICQAKLEFKCSCLRMESYGIPCEHMICVFVSLEIVNMPGCVIMPRWTKSEKDSIPAFEGNNSCIDPACVSAYLWIVESCKRMANVVVRCGKKEHIRTTLDMVALNTASLESICNGTETELTYKNPYMEGVVKNPVRARSKGCAGPSSSQTKLRTPRKVHVCSACGRKGHNRKSCHVPSSSQVVEDEYEDMSMDEDLNVIDTVIYHKLMINC